jgi:hypothetical protein
LGAQVGYLIEVRDQDAHDQRCLEALTQADQEVGERS